jgi:hypothetical protein
MIDKNIFDADMDAKLERIRNTNAKHEQSCLVDKFIDEWDVTFSGWPVGSLHELPTWARSYIRLLRAKLIEQMMAEVHD